MKDIPDIDATTPRDFERWLAGYPFNNKSKREKREPEQEEKWIEEDREERIK